MPSTVTFEHYEVMTRDDGSIYELGRGAMGITYKGLDTRLRVPVALKVINAAHLHSETARLRFVREAQSAARLRHRNVASVFHLGQEGDNYYYAMEFIDGETVDARVRQHGPLAPVLALQIAAQVARALNAAQTHELVHRDIKPANLMLVREDDELVVKVIDFGLAKVALGGPGEDAAPLTMSGFLGTPHFASPEQLEEREIDVRSDIYSLGVTLWFALTGKTPFTGSVVQVMSQHLSRQPPFEQLAQLPAPVVELLRRMLEKDSALRPQTALELRREIERCLARIGEPAALAPQPAPVDAGETSETDETKAGPEAAETQFETGAAIDSRYVVTEHIGEVESGRVFRAHDGIENRDVRLLALDRELMQDGEAIAQIAQDAAKLAALAHPHVAGVFGFVNDGHSAYLTLEWIDGFSFLDLLRARRELTLAEALALAPQAAAGIDAAFAAQAGRLNVTLPQLFVHFPECQTSPDNFLRNPIGTWPDFSVKFDALAISRDRFAVTWAGGQTFIGGARGAGGDAASPARIVREFAVVVYEILGGVPAMIGLRQYTPLASVGEAGNEILRRAILTPDSFASAIEFAQVLAQPAEVKSPVKVAAETIAPEAPPTQIRPEAASRSETAATDRAPATAPTQERSAIESAPVEEPRRSEPVSAPDEEPPAFLEPPPPSPAPSAATEPPARPPLRAPVPAPKAAPKAASSAPRRPRRRALLASTIVVALAASATVYHRVNRPVVKSGGPAPVPATLPSGNVARVAPVPPPVAPPVPPPTREELANKALRIAEALEARQSTREAFLAWLALARDYPEFGTGRNGLEQFIGLLRRRGLPRAEFDELREEITQAAQLDVLAAMMLLGEQLRRSEPATAFAWYCAAAEKGDPLAMTEAGLMSLEADGAPRDDGAAIYYLTRAADNEQPKAMTALGEYYLARGTEADAKRGAEFLQRAADKGDLVAMTTLGDCYHKGAGVRPDDKEAFRLFSEAARRGNAAAMRNLGVLYKMNAAPKGAGNSEKLAVEQFKAASEKGDALAMFFYALCLKEKGPGVKPNPAEAKLWLQKAAEKLKEMALRGKIESMYYYPASLEEIDDIDGTKEHLEETKIWYRKAAEAGSPKAAEWCKMNRLPFTPPK